MSAVPSNVRPARSGPRPVTAASRRLEGLQQLRFLAALMVLVHHTLEECSVQPELVFAPWLVLLGASGVDVFFVISGFVIWRGVQSQGHGGRASVLAFVRKRLLRVLPLYWLCLGAVIVLWATGLAFRSRLVTPASLAQSFLLLRFDGDAGLLLGVAWTLVYELYFYALCAVALRVPRPRFRLLVLFALLGLVPPLLRVCGAATAGRHYADPIVLEFVFGCLLAHGAGALAWRPSPRLAAIAGAIGLAGLVAGALLLERDGTAGLTSPVRWWGWGVPAACLVAAGASGLRIPSRAGGRLFTALGDASYALYLTHVFVMIGLARWLKSGATPEVATTLALGLGAIALSVALSRLVHVAVERPLLGWLGRSTASLTAGLRID